MKWRVFIGILLVLVAVVFLAGRFKASYVLSPPDILGGVVRLQGDTGDRVYFLTSQWEKRVTRSGSRSSSSTRTISWAYIDLWAVDSATAQPVFRRRLKRAKVNGDSVAMGVDQGVLWARLPELVGIRLTDGEIVADAAGIEARNPALAGLLPQPQTATFLTQDQQPLKYLEDAGLVVLLADARRVRIDPLSLAATPYVTPPANQSAAVGSKPDPRLIPVNTPSRGMEWRALVRGLRMEGAGEVEPWLGLIAEEELADPETLGQHVIANWWDYSKPQRQRLYRAELRPVENYYGGKVLTMMQPVPLPEAPEFLMAGLLTEGVASWQKQPALWRRNPDSVFLLSRDRLGDAGHLQLARVEGPTGRVVWSGALPLSEMSLWLPGEQHGLMLGPDPAAARSPMAQEGENLAMQIVSIDLVTGALQSFNLDLHRDWPVDQSAAVAR